MQNDQIASGAKPHDDGRPIAQVKVCPRCGARLFADMDVCFGCLYDFTRPRSAAPTLPEGDAAWDMGNDAGEGGRAEGHAVAPAQWGQPDATPAETEGAEGSWLEEVPLDEGWDSPPDQTACLGAPMCSAQAHVGLLVRSSSMDVMLPLDSRGITVGRGDDNDVVLHMRTVSRSHLRVIPEGEGVLVLDQGAVNLALANGRPVEGARHVDIGGSIDVCGAHLSVVGLDG